MSYHIVKSIKIKSDGVYITGADNNVWPRTPSEYKSSYYDKLFQEGNIEAIELDILRAYESGSFQAGVQNKYTRALAVLLHMPEYKAFDWRGNWEEYKANRETRSEEYTALLKRAFATPKATDKYVIIKDIGGKPAYMRHRRNANSCKWYYDKVKATIFSYLEDAELQKSYFTNSQDWQVVSAN